LVLHSIPVLQTVKFQGARMAYSSILFSPFTFGFSSAPESQNLLHAYLFRNVHHFPEGMMQVACQCRSSVLSCKVLYLMLQHISDPSLHCAATTMCLSKGQQTGQSIGKATIRRYAITRLIDGSENTLGPIVEYVSHLQLVMCRAGLGLKPWGRAGL
jgi:hypothetical protein